ncbi:UNVERIFIED_CONTAM: hypothetical protein Sradi_5646100 [Sesamum radiatum]|uniref:DUF7356 domain-containing protein n=1 Tax=Sesamum radiatum TaxID=300843 RepID=A0AAW2L0V6_SESRA
MKINYALLVFLLIASVICYRVTADSEEAVAATKNPVLSNTEGRNDRVSDTVDPAKKGKASDSSKHNSSEPLESKGGGMSRRRVNFAKLVTLAKSPALSLLIQNKGKVPLSITISAPDLVQLEKKQIELQENKDTEVKVSIQGVENGHFIVLTANHGNCSLNFTDQFISRKKVDHSYDSSYFNIFKLTLSTGFLFLAALLIIVVSVFTCIKFGRKYFARKGPKYQKLDMELPISHGNKFEAGENDGWDESWGDSWDDEEVPKTPSLPVTPSLSSKGIAARKSSKEGWKD